MSRHPNSIKGVTYVNNPNLVEHQWFPVEYFSGSDVTIYFGDVFLSECLSLEFGIEERVAPVFGYASRTWDCVARGNRIVSGAFEIPFTEAGYLEAITTHIGQYSSETESVKPKMAYILNDKKVPGWCADIKMDLEGLFDKFDESDGDGIMNNGKGPSSNKKAKVYTVGVKSADVAYLKSALEHEVGYVDTPLSIFIRNKYGSIDGEVCETIESDMINYDNETHSSFIKTIQETINYIYNRDSKNRFSESERTYTRGQEEITRRICEISIDGVFDSVSSDSLKNILNWFRFNANQIKYTQSNIYENSDKIKITADILKFMLGFYDIEKYDVQTYLQVTSYQESHGFEVTGTITSKDINPRYNSSIIRPDEVIGDVSPTKPQTSFGPDAQFTRYEDRMGRYEAEVWGRDFSDDPDHKFQTFFYKDKYKNAGLDGTNYLMKKGFDIYIVYGPAPEAQKYNTYHDPNGIDATALDTYSFATTVKAIRGVQITGSRQVLNADGRCISEIYTFIAKDLD